MGEVAARYRLGIDIGGTFTDFVLMDDETGETVTLKTPSVPRDPARAVLDGTHALVDRHGVDPAAIGTFVHGTTLAVNTIIQRSGAVTGLLVTRGFKDILEIGRLRLPDPTNYYVRKPRPLTPRKFVREIDERLLPDGRVYRPLDLAGVDRAVRDLLAHGVEALAVCFMHAYSNDEHERRAADYIRETFPDLYVCSSAAIWPQQREYERAVIAVMNAHVGDRMRSYFDHLDRNVRELRMPATILTTRSNGGVMTAASASRVPVETLLSGPAAGVMGALHVGRQIGHERLITLDIGGTSADVAVIDGGVLYSTESQVGDFPVFMPAVDVASIGAGGGSVAWADTSNVLKVGPRSAGADPGPACYGRGGTEPAVTDAYVRLGFIDPARFLGGRMPLDAGLAGTALARLGERLGFDAVGTAAAIVDIATANMDASFAPLMAQKGVDPRDFAILAYGGAGPTHACLLARDVGIRDVIVPEHPGTLCARGCLLTDIRSDFVRTLGVASDDLTPDELAAEFGRLEARALAWLADQAVPVTDRYTLRSADMRYHGQSFDITVALPSGDEPLTPEAIRAPFHESYGRIYGFADRDAAVEIVNLRVTVVGATPKPQSAPTGTAPAERLIRPARTRPIMESGRWSPAGVFDRLDLRPGDRFAGPAVVEAADTTVVVPAGFGASVDAWRNLRLRLD